MPLLDEAVVNKAVRALLKFHENQRLRKGGGGEPDAMISLQLGLRKVPDASGQAKPLRIAIPHPLRGAAPCQMCLFVKEDAKKVIKEALGELPGGSLPGLTKILGTAKLRTAYKQGSLERRKLCAAYDLFLCDERLLAAMPAMLGQEFYEKKKLPVPVCVGNKRRFARSVAAARDSTYLRLGGGPCCAVRIGTTGMDQAPLVANAMVAIEGVVGHIPQKWTNVKSVHLKTPESIALPLFRFMGREYDDEAVAVAAAAAAGGGPAVAEMGESAQKKRKALVESAGGRWHQKKREKRKNFRSGGH